MFVVKSLVVILHLRHNFPKSMPCGLHNLLIQIIERTPLGILTCKVSGSRLTQPFIRCMDLLGYRTCKEPAFAGFRKVQIHETVPWGHSCVCVFLQASRVDAH